MLKYFGECIAVLTSEEAQGLVCGASVGADMVCLNPQCPIETHKTGERGFTEKRIGVFLRAGSAPTKRFRFTRDPIADLDLFERHSSILRRIKEYEPSNWQDIRAILNRPTTTRAALEEELRAKTTLLPSLTLPEGEEYFLPKVGTSSTTTNPKGETRDEKEEFTPMEEDTTTDEEVQDWPRSLKRAEANLARSNEEAMEIAQYDDLLSGDFLEQFEYQPSLKLSDIGKPHQRLSEEMLRFLKVLQNKFDTHSSTTRAAQKLIFERLSYQERFLEKDPFDAHVGEYRSVWAPVGKLLKGAERSKARFDRVSSELNEALTVVQMLAEKEEQQAARRSSSGSRVLESSSVALSQGIEEGWSQF